MQDHLVLTIGMDSDGATVTLPAHQMPNHLAILGTVAGRLWEETLLVAQGRRGGGWIVFDLWPSVERRTRLARGLAASGRQADFYVLDDASTDSDCWNPLLSGTVADVAAKLGQIGKPTHAGQCAAMQRGHEVITAALRAANIRPTLSDIAGLWGSLAELHALAERVPHGEAKAELLEWLLHFAVGGGELLLQRLSAKFSDRLDEMLSESGCKTFDTALPTVVFDSILADQKCLYVPVDRCRHESVAHAKLVALELTQALRRRDPTQGALDSIVMLGDVARVLQLEDDLPTVATRAGVGLVLTMAPSEVTGERAKGVCSALLEQAQARLLCPGDALSCGTPTSEDAVLLQGVTQRNVQRPVAELALATAPLALARHSPLALAAGEDLLDLQAATSYARARPMFPRKAEQRLAVVH